MDNSSRKSNKIRDIVRLQQILKKWKKVANSNKTATTNTASTTATTKSIKFLKKTLSFTESSTTSGFSNSNAVVPKGFIAVCVGQELKRYVIPTQHLRHQVFGVLLREAEEEFGFQQEGVLRLPCEVDVFEKILKMMEDKRSFSSPSLILLNGSTDDHDFNGLVGEHDLISTCCSSNNYSSPDSELTSTTPSLQHPQLCR